MKLKLDDAGNVVIKDGMPVYVHSDGKEIPFDAAAATSSISRLKGEAQGHREAKESLESKLKAFEGISDAAKAREALEIVKNLDAKKLVDAGEVERVKAEAVRAYEDKIKQVEAKIAPIEQERDAIRSALHGEKIGHAFASSKLINERLAIPSDIAQAMFGTRFKVDGNEIVALDGSGNKMLSRSKPGDVAAFDEALEMIVEAYPNRDRILKGTGASGGGANGGGNGGGGKRTVTRAEFDRMDAQTKADTARKAGKGEINLVDS